MTPLRIVIASANRDKAEELRDLLLGELGGRVELLERPAEVPDVEETGATLEENARLKADALRDATGLASLSDDTGLEVRALGGAPGVLSARYAGEGASYGDNVEKLLVELGSQEDRRATFRTVCVLALPDGRELVSEGSVAGSIATAPSGDRGFGYDPVFCPEDAEGRSYAELTPAEKHALSHRGAAVRAMARLLRDELDAAAIR